MAKFSFSNAAAADIDSICNYIAKDNVTAAIKLLTRIESICDMLAENPDLGESRRGFGVPDCRSFTIGRYVIFFRATVDGIEVARILDASRDL